MRSLLAWTVLFMLVSGRSEARTWRVVADGTGDTSTIQEALDLCAVGDSVSVLPGTYFENLVIAKPLTLCSTSGAQVTRIDGNQSGRVITVTAATEGARRITGFTICHGFANDGGGVLIQADATMLHECIIEYNSATLEHTSSGGGVEVTANFCVVDGNTVRSNLASGTGGGLVVFGSQNVVTNNTISGNGCHAAGGGAAVGAGIFSRNLVVGNWSDTSTGGLTLGAEGSYNTIVHNRGPLAVFVGLSEFHHNIVVQNQGVGVFCSYVGGINGQVVSCNDVWGNGSDALQCTGGTVTDNISADPLFCPEALYSPYQISAHSPCAGANPACGPIGAFGTACLATAVKETTWTDVRRIYR